MRYVILYASVLMVGALAMRPKLSLAVMSTVPVTLAVAESRVPGGLPDWLLITGIIVTALCLAAVLVAFFVRRSGDVGGAFGSLPLGREVRYSRADKAGLAYTFALLCIVTAGCGVAVYNPPHQSAVVRIIALLLIPLFGALAVAFWLLCAIVKSSFRSMRTLLKLPTVRQRHGGSLGVTFRGIPSCLESSVCTTSRGEGC